MPKQLPAYLHIPLMYTLFSGAWILLSDRLAAFLVPDAMTLTRLQTFKGWAFVLCSAILIQRLVRTATVRSQRVEHDLRRANRALNVLSTINRALVHAQDEPGFLTRICQVCVEVGGYRLAWIGLAGDDAQTGVQLAAQMGCDDGDLDTLTTTWSDMVDGLGPTGTAIGTGQPCVIRNLLEDARATPWRTAAVQRGYASALALPLIHNGTTLGALTLYAAEANAFDPTEVQLLADLARDLAYGLASLRVRAERERLAADLAEERNLLAQRVAERTSALSAANGELERAVRAKDAFLANMSHELRTPLNAILGNCELLLEQIPGPLAERQQRIVSRIDASGRHLLDLITDILDLAKVEAGQMDLQRQPVLIDDVCRASLLFVQEQATKKRIEIGVAITNQLTYLEADPRRLKQILVNLLSNAVKFTEPGGRVQLSVNVDSVASLVRFVVEDSGIGIAPADLARLFQPFIQVDASLSRRYEGTGLGLALVRRLADLHGGGVAVESTVGVGSRFTLSLPYRPPSSDAPAPLATPSDSVAGSRSALGGVSQAARPEDWPTALIAPEAGSAPAGKQVLLADDNECTRVAISDYLQAKGYHVVIARTGYEAIARAGQGDPAVILMDVQMPEMDGLEATRRLRATPVFAHTPIIALTALTMPGDRERCLAAGATAYLTKPVNLRSLVAMLDRLMYGCDPPRT